MSEEEEYTILIVDDDTELLDIVESYLKDYHIIRATNGSEAVNLYKKYQPLIVLMDIHMPIMDGIEATKKIKEIDPEAEIITITGHASSRKDEAILAGARTILPKPLRLPTLLQEIENYIKKQSETITHDRLTKIEENLLIYRRDQLAEIKIATEFRAEIREWMSKQEKNSEILKNVLEHFVKGFITAYNLTMLVILIANKIFTSETLYMFIQENKNFILMMGIGITTFVIFVVVPIIKKPFIKKNKTKKVIFALTEKERREAKLRYQKMLKKL